MGSKGEALGRFPTRCERICERDAYVLRRNIYRYFPAVDHAILNPKPDGETVSSDEPAKSGTSSTARSPRSDYESVLAVSDVLQNCRAVPGAFGGSVLAGARAGRIGNGERIQRVRELADEGRPEHAARRIGERAAACCRG